MQAFTVLFLCTAVGVFGVQWWLHLRHRGHVLRHRAAVPAAFAATLPLEQHQKAADYTVARVDLACVSNAVDLVLLLAFTVGGGVALLHTQTSAWFTHPLAQGVTLIVLWSIIGSALQVPLEWYRTFHLEQRFGFNTQTPRLFWIDLAKQTLLSALIGIPLLTLVLWLFQAMGAQWWLWVWAVLVGWSLLMMLVVPVWIAPLFNKFKPLDDPAMAERIQALLQRCGFASNGIFVMDGSTRSRHGNAYFTGLGRNKRIVFFDTLLANLTPPQIDAVLAHELGHFHHGHVKKRLILMAGLGLGLLWLLGVLANAPWFYTGLGVNAQSPALALLLFMLTLPVFFAPLAPLFNILSRRDEFEADRFAVLHTQRQDLIDALAGLYKENATTVTPDPLYSLVYHSHPPASIRIAALEAR